MPRLASEVYAGYHDIVLKLAGNKEGISRAQIMDSLNVSRPIADTMIKRCGLAVARKEGRTEFFIAPNGSTSGTITAATPPPVPAPTPTVLPPEAKAVVSPVAGPIIIPVIDLAIKAAADSDASDDDDEAAEVTALDEEIFSARTALRDAAAKCGKAMGDWAVQQALVDALRENFQKLAARRLELSE